MTGKSVNPGFLPQASLSGPGELDSFRIRVHTELGVRDDDLWRSGMGGMGDKDTVSRQCLTVLTVWQDGHG